jgi:maleylpyruvate isomerase
MGTAFDLREDPADMTKEPLVLHGYWRSTASWRVRIALGLKGLAWQGQSHDLRSGEQRAADYLALNPQGFVPALEVGGEVLTQSLSIIEYLDEAHPEPALLPADPLERARVRAFAQVIACDIHPVQNLKVLKMLKARGLDQAATDAWAAEIIEGGLKACAGLIANREGPYCFGSQVTLADVLLVPQLGNARRFGARFDFGRIAAIEQACSALPAFAAARPEAQPDADI